MKTDIPFKKIMDKTADLVMITKSTPLDSPNGPEIIYVNQAIIDLTGYSQEELIGKTPRILQGPKTNQQTIKKIRDALNKEKKIVSASLFL